MPRTSHNRTDRRAAPPPRPIAGAGVTDGRRRVVVERVQPEVNAGRFPIKRTVGESVRVTAWIHADGHDVLAAVLRCRPAATHAGPRAWLELPMRALGNDEWEASFAIDRQCDYEYTVDAWVDHVESWCKALTAKVDAGQDVSSELLQGAALIRAVARRARAHRAMDEARWLDTRADVIEGSADVLDRARAGLDQQLAGAARRFPDRSNATTYGRVLTVSVDRERARRGAWYEMFPRSWGPDPTRSATFGEAEAHLERVAAMGFDVVYLPPIHPIGTSFRKGRGNSLRPEPGDPGSPWAIGSEAGGHKAVDPGLGTIDDFEHFVGEARRLGLEVALDLAYQCSPDHPYVREHPEWFRHRPDGTIVYAENPPKKYQDIYPFDFDCGAWQALWRELKSIVEFWIARGVSIFRVDNPHTKPYAFWEWLIREIRSEHPDVVFLAEAFTRPKVMYYLAKLGFTQSYTYFTWRNSKEELTEYFTELTGTEVVEFFRPNLFANTPDILHAYLQLGGPPAFKIRLILAAMLGATYGIYNGFELCENRAVPGTEEYLESEKYQYRRWDWDRPGQIRDLVTAVNRIRRENPALHADRSLTFCTTENPDVIAFYKVSPDRSNGVLVVVNLDYARMQHGRVKVPLSDLGLPPSDPYEVVDLLDGARYTWQGEWNYVRLDPLLRVAHIFALPLVAREAATGIGTALQALLPRQRWFAGKARTITDVRLVDWSPAGALPQGLTAAIAGVAYADGGEERYFTPLILAPDAVTDASEDEDGCRALLAALLDERSIAMRHGIVRPTVYGGQAPVRRLRIVRSATEQSNTCVRFGERYMLKLLRRLEPGPNPEVEISTFLAGRGLACIPPLVATLDYVRDGEEPTALALLQGFVANDGTAWDRAVDDARRFILDEDPPERRASRIDFLAAAATLGRRTAELHAALASDDRNPAFAPEALTGDHAALLGTSMQQDAERTLALLAERRESLPGPARSHARAVLDARTRLTSRILAVSGPPAASMRTRVHGDYHLGQLLSVGQDFVIIDFEGEPARSLAERRMKHSPLKDVAGMVRSFDYAAYAALPAAPADDPNLVARLEPRARQWAASVSTAFLKSYRQTIGAAALVPDDDVAFGRLLDAYVLEKTLYELGYELASRPEWASIPLQGIRRMLDAPAPQTGVR